MNPPNVSNQGASPIADLSYRNYDGAVRSRALRWWTVALSVLRGIRRKPAFWVLCVIGLLPYLINGVMFYLTNQVAAAGMGVPQSEHPYAERFFNAMDKQEFWLFLTALVVGADCIAGDLRANALLIYLSKPITKGDYLLGKWMGVFLPLYFLSVAPALILFLCSALGMFGPDFFKTEPTLFFRMVAATAVPAIVHTSILVGFSAWSKSGRIAGAAYAGFYLISALISGIIGGLTMRSAKISGLLVQHLSVSGAVTGIGQTIYNVKTPGMPQWGIEAVALPHSFGLQMFAIAIVLCAVGIIMARSRVNAVEVVRG